MRVPQILIIGDDPIVDADGLGGEDRMIVAGNDLGSIGDHAAVADDRERFVQLAIGRCNIGKSLVQKDPISVGSQHRARR